MVDPAGLCRTLSKPRSLRPPARGHQTVHPPEPLPLSARASARMHALRREAQAGGAPPPSDRRAAEAAAEDSPVAQLREPASPPYGLRRRRTAPETIRRAPGQATAAPH